MLEYLRRLATTGAAYTASSVVSKLLAVVLLPIYTPYLTPADYGAAEVMLAAVVAGSIVIRLGVIEAILRFYYLRRLLRRPRLRLRAGQGGNRLRRPPISGAHLAQRWFDRLRVAVLDDDGRGSGRAWRWRGRSRRRCSRSPMRGWRGWRSSASGC